MADKELKEMSLAELGQLFPIRLKDYDPAWPVLYKLEKERIETALGDLTVRIRHIGSTSVPCLIAKPTIDILLEIRDDSGAEPVKRIFRKLGYHFSPQPQNPPPHMMFMKGYTKQGFKGQAYHVHVRFFGDWDEPYFAEYLLKHADAAEKYGDLKRMLKEKYEHNREAYTQAKTDFIREIIKLARKEAIDHPV